METWLRRSYVLVAIAIGVVVTLAGGAAAVRSSHGGLGFGSVSGLEGAAADVDAPFVRAYADRTVVHGMLSIRNDGRWSVRVEKVGIEPPEYWHGLVSYRPDRNVLRPPNDYGYDGPAFAPFTLKPGEERGVSVALWIDNCEHNAPGVSNTIKEVPVRYRIGGMARTAWIELDGPWTITTDGVRCPRPPAWPGG